MSVAEAWRSADRIWLHCHMAQYTFSDREDGQIDAHLHGEWPVFNEALSDSISSLPPRRRFSIGPSTYWIDIAVRGAQRAAQNADEHPFTCGNCTALRVKDGLVYASYDFDEPSDDDEAIPLRAFLELLSEWRRRVVESSSTTRFPNTYRRNPANRTS